MRRTCEVVFLALFVLFLKAPAGGGDITATLVATIPFEFTVGNQEYPAGTYCVGRQALVGNAAVVAFGDHLQTMNHRVVAFSAPPKFGNPSLDFRLYRYRDQNGLEQSSYFLFRVNPGYGEMGRELGKSKTELAIERETRQRPLRSTSASAQSMQPEIISVAASR